VATEYRLRRRVQYHETDAAGIVHFSCFFRYMEEAEHALWRDAGLSIHPPESEIGWPRIAASCDFHAVLRFEDEFDVWIRVADLTRKTMRYTFELVRGATKIATGTISIACVRRRPDQPMQAIEIPADIAARFQAAHES
jgi:acyl-CoA thioester hydrolase